MTRKLFLIIVLLICVRPAVALQKNTRVTFEIQDGVVRSIDGGTSWIQSNAGLPQGIGARRVTPILSIGSTEAADGQYVYALTETDGVYRWNSGDNAWISAHGGLPVPFQRRTEGSLLALDPSDGSRLYTLLNIPVTSEREQALIFGSSDGARRWLFLKDLSDVARIVEMVVQPDGRLRLRAEDGSFYTIEMPLNLNAAESSEVTLASLLGDGTPLVGTRISLAEDVNNIAIIEDDGLIVGSPIDIANRSFEFRPTAAGSYDLIAIEPTFDDDTGDFFLLGDEDARFVQLPMSFPFYGVERTSMFINSNGNLSFLQRDLDSSPTIEEFVARPPKIAPLWADFDPRTGSVYLKQTPDKVIVSWLRVPIYTTTAPNNFQVVLHADGRIRFNSEASVLEGNEWRDDGNGNFTATNVVQRYSRLDQYLMGLRAPSEVPPVMLITDPQPVVRGSITGFTSTMGLLDNGIRETGRNLGPVDSLRNFVLRVAYTGDTKLFSSAPVYSNGVNDAGPAPDTVATKVNNLRSLAASAAGVPYEITHLPTSGPHARYYDSTTGKFSGDNITIQGTRTDVLFSQIMEYEGERQPRAGLAQTAFRHAFILVVPKGGQATATDLARMNTVRRGWESFYGTATDGLSSVSTELSTGVSRITSRLNGGAIATMGSAGTAAAANVAYGRLEVGTDRTSGLAFLTGRTGTRVTTETAVPALGTSRRSRVYIERTSDINTGVVVVSPLGATTVSLQLRSSDGTAVASNSLELANGAQVSRFVHELFPAFTFSATFRGSLSLTSTIPVAVVSLRTTVNESGEFLMTTAPAADLSELTSSVSYLSHFADGGGYVTDVILMNTEAAPIAGSLDWRSSAGALLSAAVQYTVPAHGITVISTSGTGALQSGYVAVRADGQAGPVVRSIIKLRQTGRLVAMTGMFPAASARRIQALVDLSQGHDSGLALLNDGANPAVIRFNVYNSRGGALSLTTTINLPARSQTSKFVSQLFPSLPVGFRGILEISSSTPLQAVALRSTTTSDRFLLAAFPVQSLDTQPTDAVLYFPQLVDGAGYTSEIFLMNSGTQAASPRVLFLSPQAQPTRILFADTH